MHDQLGPCQSGSVQKAASVRPITTDRSDRSHQRPGKVPSPKQEYQFKEKEEVKTTVDTRKLKVDAIVQIDDVKVAVKDVGKGPTIFKKIG